MKTITKVVTGILGLGTAFIGLTRWRRPEPGPSTGQPMPEPTHTVRRVQQIRAATAWFDRFFDDVTGAKQGPFLAATNGTTPQSTGERYFDSQDHDM